jgi:ribosomal-protein-alanine acetyltransferase/2-amino-4-hydroxy-6-hydroxymethyldihydropteridine diphosphokinase
VSLAKDSLHNAFISLGSNLGDSKAIIKQGIELINSNASIQVLYESSLLQNPAIEDAGPNDFINSVIKVSTSLSARDLFLFLQQVERSLDPDRESRGRKLARYLDLDLLTFDDLLLNESDLILPHPRMNKRDFILKLIREIEINSYVDEYVSDTQDYHYIPLPDFSAAIPANVKSIANKINNLLKNRKDFKLRRIYLDDLDTILKIDAEGFGPKHWTREVFVKELSNPYAIYLLAESKGLLSKKILGFIGIWIVLDEMHIMTLATASKVQNQKVAQYLLLAAIEIALSSHIRNLSLEVKVDNEAAKHIYEKFGFFKQGSRPKYYADGTDAILYGTENIQESDQFRDNLEALIASFAMTLSKQL